MAEARTIRIVAWLLARVLPPSSAEALVGDFAESHKRGRSSWWVWRQACGAIVVLGRSEFRAHPVRLARAIAIACLTYVTVAYVSVHWFGPRSFSLWTYYSLIGSWYFAAAFVSVRSHRHQAGGLMLALLAALIVWTIPDLIRVILNGLEDPRYLPYVVNRLEYFAVACLGGGLGAITGVRGHRQQDESPSVE